MTRGKKGRLSVTDSQAAKETPLKEESTPKAPRSRGRFSILDYVFVTVFFIIFMYIQKYVALKMLGSGGIEQLSLNFFFDTLWKGFLIIIVLVGLHDFFYKGIEEEDSP